LSAKAFALQLYLELRQVKVIIALVESFFGAVAWRPDSSNGSAVSVARGASRAGQFIPYGSGDMATVKQANALVGQNHRMRYPTAACGSFGSLGIEYT
jgi:hypothetical protein